jgi:hypothetical protein
MSTSATDPRPTDKPGRRVPPYLSHRLLCLLAETLSERGMEVHQHTHGDETIQLAVTNPHDPDRGGRAEIGYGGYLAWERWVEFNADADMAAVAEIILDLLTVKSSVMGRNHERVIDAHGRRPWAAGNRIIFGQGKGP